LHLSHAVLPIEEWLRKEDNRSRNSREFWTLESVERAFRFWTLERVERAFRAIEKMVL
jgi:hypothetical protein